MYSFAVSNSVLLRWAGFSLDFISLGLIVPSAFLNTEIKNPSTIHSASSPTLACGLGYRTIHRKISIIHLVPLKVDTKVFYTKDYMIPF